MNIKKLLEVEISKKLYKELLLQKKVGLEPVKINSVVYNTENNEMKIALKQYAKEMGAQIRFITQMHLETGEFSVVEGGTGGDCAIL